MADPPHSSGKHELRVIDGPATHSTLNFGSSYCAPFRDSEPVCPAAVGRRGTRSPRFSRATAAPSAFDSQSDFARKARARSHASDAASGR